VTRYHGSPDITADTQPSPCTNCGKINDAATSVDLDSAKPGPGDIAVCLYCGHVMAFDEQIRLRNLTDAEVINIAGDPKLVRVGNALKLRANLK
jgi:hypothetical protein